MDRYQEEYCELSNVLDKIKKDGVAVIPNVISKSKLNKYRKQLWETFNHITKNLEKPISFKDLNSWRNIYELFPLHSMLIQHWGVGHSELVWNIRLEKKVIEVFSKLWNTKPEELLTSFDGVSFHMPPEVTNKGWYRGNDWFHTDQSRLKKGLSCIQGMVTLYDVNQGDATFSYKQKSHLLHEKFFTDNKVESKSDWYKLSKDEMKYFKNCKPKRILAKAGSLILWDSRLFHCGSEPLKERAKPNFRGIVYVCMTPREWASEHNLKKKRKAFENKRMTTHWPHHIRLFSKTPRTYGNDISDLVDAKPVNELNELGMKLAGY